VDPDPAEVELRDGTVVRMRAVVPADRELFVAAFERLSPESRYRRFFSPVEELSSDVLDYLTRIDYVNHFAWVALAGEPGKDDLVGISRYVRLDDPAAAEGAVTVVDEYQARGLGTLLLAALVLRAVEHGIARLEGDVLAENQAMQHVLRGAGAHLHTGDAGVMRFEMDLPERSDALAGSAPQEVLRAVARGEADLYQLEPCPWLTGLGDGSTLSRGRPRPR